MRASRSLAQHLRGEPAAPARPPRGRAARPARAHSVPGALVAAQPNLEDPDGHEHAVDGHQRRQQPNRAPGLYVE